LPPVPNLPAFKVEWNLKTPYAANFVVEDNIVTMVSDNRSFYQLVGNDHLKGLITIKATIIKYGGRFNEIAIGLLTEGRKNEECSGWKGNDHQYSAALWTNPLRRVGCIYVDGNVVTDNPASLFIP
jgi:hypothetical protein